MKKFILKVSIFLLILVSFFSINYVLNQLIIRNTVVNINNEILFVGDSHIQNALNPKFLPGSINIAQPAEPYIITYWKLKNILEFNQRVKIVVLGFAPHNIAKFNDYKFSDPKWMSEMFNRSYTIQEFSSIKDKVSIDFKEFYKVVFKKTSFYPHKNHLGYIGSYSNSTRNKTNDSEVAIGRHFYYKSIYPEVSETSINYLDSIVKFVSNKQKTLILINTPVHESYANKVPQKVDRVYHNLVDKYKNEEIIVIDKYRASYNDSLFLNSDHINEYGATKFTKELRQILKNENH